ncbi:hypothetical protein [Haloglomus litoreum]|uniref:hypothetical protein n=1 Tax=Haloglomus litoreum TaxID=3034026 RepID=UPI0023E8F2D5|nr:hypothetical protein [Haloglomus sp. DT116]
MDRRKFLGASSLAAGVGLAGCGFIGSALGKVPPPEVDQTKLEAGGWREDAEESGKVFTQEYAAGTVTARGHTIRYQDEALRQEIAEKTLGSVTGQLSVFFATRIEFDPELDSLPLGIGREEVLQRTKESAKSDFEREMEADGLTDIEVLGESTLAVDSGQTADLVRYSATYPVDDFGFTVTGGETITLEGQPVPVRGWLAVWYNEDVESTLVSGAVHAAENYTDTIDKQLSSALDMTLDIDLGLTPDAYREEAFGLIRTVT